MNFNFAFENEFFAIMDKPSGVLSVPGRFQDDGRTCLGRELQEHLKIQIFPVHRLDFEVSGLVLYAKNADSHRAANAWFEKKEVHKTYRAVTEGPDFSHWPSNLPRHELREVLEPGLQFEWKCRILRGKKRSYESPQGQTSLTLAMFREQAGKRQHWDLNPVTGRSHQLRYEMSRHGFPIIGDALYGSKVSFGENAIALRAYRIDFSDAPDFKRWNLPPLLEISLA